MEDYLIDMLEQEEELILTPVDLELLEREEFTGEEECH